MTDLRKVLQDLKAAGKITDEDILEIVGPSDEFKQLVDTMHLLLCLEDHEKICSYELEEVYDKCWEAPNHVEWKEKAEAVLAEFKLDDVAGLHAIIAALHIIKAQPLAVIYFIASYHNGNPIADQAEDLEPDVPPAS